MRFYFLNENGTFSEDTEVELVPFEKQSEDRPSQPKEPPEARIKRDRFPRKMSRVSFDAKMARRAKYLIRSGQMPNESEFWRAVYEVRREFAPRIRRARRENEAQLKLDWVN